MKEGERGQFFPKLRVRIKDNNSSPHGKFYRFLFPFPSKFSDLNFAPYVLYIYLHTVSLGYLWFYQRQNGDISSVFGPGFFFLFFTQGLFSAFDFSIRVISVKSFHMGILSST